MKQRLYDHLYNKKKHLVPKRTSSTFTNYTMSTIKHKNYKDYVHIMIYTNTQLNIMNENQLFTILPKL